MAQLRPRYEVDPEERIYIETAEPDPSLFVADVVVAGTLPMPLEERESYLAIRKTGEKEVVCVIEVLSPTNKRAVSDGRREYLAKRRCAHGRT